MHRPSPKAVTSGCIIVALALATGAAALPTPSVPSTRPASASRAEISSASICEALRTLGAASYAKALVETLSGGKIARGNKILDLAVGTAFTHCEYLLPKAEQVARFGLQKIFGPSSPGPRDTSAPIAVAPGVTIPGTYNLGTTGNIEATVYWGGFDLDGTIVRYSLASRYSTGGSWSNWSTVSTGGGVVASRQDMALARGHSYQFAARAQDGAGNWSNWAYGKTFSITVFREDESQLGGQWYISTGPNAVDGRTYYSSQSGATVRRVFVGSYVAWVAPRWSGAGVADVYVDRVRLQRVNLYSASTAARQIVSAWIWPYSGQHEIEIRVVSGRVDVDAFAVLT